MNSPLRPVIRVDEDRCVNCHACIDVCPVKLCIDGSGEKVRLRSELCIGCGECIKACTHGAREGVDDLEAFLEARARGERFVAISAPAVIAKYPADYLRLNGWLKTMNVDAVFDVSFGAELTVESYIRHITEAKPALVIAQPCPAIVSYIELYQPELLPYLAPAHSPMSHSLVMIRKDFPEFRNHKLLIISPCVAKRREFDATGLGDYNVTLEKLSAYLEGNKIRLSAFPETPFTGPAAERAILFSSPGGLKETVERERPELSTGIRKIEGPHSIYPYLKSLPASLSAKANPLIVDCLNCEKGCNGGTGTGLSETPADILEAAVRKRLPAQRAALAGARGLRKPAQRTLKNLAASIKRHWRPGIFARSYSNRSREAGSLRPTEAQLSTIYRTMRKIQEEDFLNCAACGYGSCEGMAVAIHNGLNKPENCQHYSRLVLEESKSTVAQMSFDMDREIGRSVSLVESLKAMLPELDGRTSHEAESLSGARRKIEDLLAELGESSQRAGKRKDEIEALRGSAILVQKELASSLDAVRGLSEQMRGVHVLVSGINKIASQTNLLSMNASIEAAHAGSSGQGFAVVASEIRGLADRAGRSASEITKTLADMGKKMEAAAASTENSGASIRGVLGDLERNASGLEEIFTSLSSISSETGEIEAAIEELSAAAGGATATYRRMETELKSTADEIAAIARISRENVKKIEAM